MALRSYSTGTYLDAKTLQKIDEIVRKKPQKYDSRSHFLRCAAIKQARKEA